MCGLSIKEAAERLGIGDHTVRKMAKRYLAGGRQEWGLRPPQPGELPCVRMGDPNRGKIRFPEAALERMGL